MSVPYALDYYSKDNYFIALLRHLHAFEVIKVTIKGIINQYSYCNALFVNVLKQGEATYVNGHAGIALYIPLGVAINQDNGTIFVYGNDGSIYKIVASGTYFQYSFIHFRFIHSLFLNYP